MTENHSIRYWLALIISSIVSIFIALAIIVLCKLKPSISFYFYAGASPLAWYLLWKLVLSRFGVIRALLQINNNDQQPAQQSTTATRQQPIRRQHIRRE